MSTIAIVGRPNVGKSTIFNRLVGQRKSIIDDQSGVTRDRIYGECEWGGKRFNVIDTGGFVAHSTDIFEKAISEQVQIAIDEADLILFMVDVTCGITDLDDDMAKLLRRIDKKVILIVNKVDNYQRMYEANEFYSLGFSNVSFISSISGSGTGDLLDMVIEHVEESKPEKKEDIPHVAIVGQPNVGKSSMINVLAGENRNIVTDIAGTTRDTLHTRFSKFERDYLFIDTAGIRKKAKVHENLEFYSVIRAIKAIDKADVCMMMIDAKCEIEAQDLSIFRLIVKKRKGVVVVVNKWDLIEKDTHTAKAYEQRIREKLAPFSDVPIIFTSVKEKQRILKTLDTITQVYTNRQQKINTSELNKVMLKAIERNHPPAVKGKFIQIKYVTQLPTYTPSFAFFANHPKYIKEPYRNYLENQLRKAFNFTGVPLGIYFRQK